MPRFPTKTLTAVALVAAALARPAGADERRDHDQARIAVERGEARRLADILRIVKPGLDGDVVGVEFERQDGRWVYELKVLDRQGRRTDVYVDARDGRILRRKGK